MLDVEFISRGRLVRIVSSPATVLTSRTGSRAAAADRSKRQRAAAGDGDRGPRQGVMDGDHARSLLPAPAANCQSLAAVA